MPEGRKTLGLALAGGVARGLAHIGVIQTLEEAGIQADYVSGVSAGAIVGACYAAGLNAAGLARLADKMTWLDVARPSLLNPFRRGINRLGLLDFFPLEKLIIRTIGDLTFEELPRPLAIGVTDVVSGEPRVLTSGRVALAVRASASIPGVVVPVRWRGRLIADGGFSNNVPIAILRRMGAEVVVAVNVMPRHRTVPTGFYWALSGALSSLMLRAADPLSDADLAIEPDLAEAYFTWFVAKDLIARGRAAAEPLIPQLQQLLA